MSRENPKDKAEATLRAAGIEDEQAVMVQEGFSSRGARTFDDTVGMTIPGASLLIGGSQRVVLLTDRAVHLFQGRRHDRLGRRLATYPLTATVMSFDGEVVTFPDGQVVYITSFQAQSLARAASVDQFAGTAAQLLERAGITDEQALTAEAGIDPRTSRKTAGTVLADVVVGDLDRVIDGTGSKESEGRIVLVTDRNVHLFLGEKLSEPGPLLASFPTGPGTLRREDRRLIFPDGNVVEFRGVTDIPRILEAAGVNSHQ
jgi:hypothetical protein